MILDDDFNSCTSCIFQKQDTKLIVLRDDLLGNVYPSASPLESDQLHHSGTLTYKENGLNYSQLLMKKFSTNNIPVTELSWSEDEFTSLYAYVGLWTGTVCWCCAGRKVWTYTAHTMKYIYLAYVYSNIMDTEREHTFPNQMWWLESNPMGSFEEMHIIADGFFPSHIAICGVGAHCGQWQ